MFSSQIFSLLHYLTSSFLPCSFPVSLPPFAPSVDRLYCGAETFNDIHMFFEGCTQRKRSETERSPVCVLRTDVRRFTHAGMCANVQQCTYPRTPSRGAC